MRIIECNIDKFGVICNKKFTFSPNMNCMLEENGVGKTTLCAFIKAMLYGIGDTKKTSLDENDRKRYLPWSGGSAQGSLTFSVKSKVYRIERTFGAKASEDSFALYDARSGQISLDFTENLGSELFGIDRDGYEETVYLSERSLAPTGENKSVAAKLSDLVGADGDIGVMDEAMKILESQRKFLQKKGSVGAISDLKRALYEKGDEISNLSRREGEISSAEARLSEIGLELDKIKTERDALMTIKAESAKRELYLGFEEKCKQLITEIESESAEKDSIIQKLGGEVPKREYIDALRLDYIEAQKLLESGSEQNESSDELSKLSALFASETSNKDIESLKDSLSDYKEQTRIKVTKEYAEVESTFKKRIPSSEECDEAIAALTATSHPKRKPLNVIGIILAVIALPFIPLGVMITPVFYAVSGAMLALTLTLISLSAHKTSKAARNATRRAEELLRSISDEETESAELLSKLVKIRSLIDKAEEMLGDRLSASEEAIAEVLSSYGRSCTNLIAEAELLIRDHERYTLLRLREGVRLEGAEKDKGRAKELMDGIRAAFSRMGIVFSGSFSEIYALLNRYGELSASIIAKREEYTRYKTETKLEPGDTSMPTGEEFNARISALDARSRELNAELGVLNMRLRDLNAMLAERGALISERDQISDKLAQYEENLAVILKTKEMLTKAKDNIQSKYLGKTEASFTKYVEKISGVSGEYRLDTDFNVTKSEGGISRPSAAYSRGTRGLYNLAARLALIDSLYEGESPFIILDDPFAYLDDEKMKSAGEVVRKLSSDRQIIYLTCVKSRCIKNP